MALPSSGQISFGDVNIEIKVSFASWQSGRADSYLVGATGFPSYTDWSVNSLYGWMGQNFGFRTYWSTDYSNGNYDLTAEVFSCEYEVLGYSPQYPIANGGYGGQYGYVDTTVNSYVDVTYWNGFALDFYPGSKYADVTTGNAIGTRANTALCFNPGLCYVDNVTQNGQSPSDSGSTSLSGFTTFYLGNFFSTTRLYNYSYIYIIGNGCF